MPDRPTTKDARRDAAREKARQMRELEARRKRRNRVLALSAGVVAVVLVIGFVALAVTRSGGGGSTAAATPPGVTADGGIVLGQSSAPHTVTIFQDYQCPVCKAYEPTVAPWLQQQVEAGTTKVEYRPISFLNAQSGGTEYSSRAANAAFCVAGKQGVDFFAFNAAMYEQQPEEGGSGLTDNKLVSIAESAGATGVGTCIADRTYDAFVTSTTKTAMSSSGDGVSGTPTVMVDGKVLQSAQGGAPDQATLATALGVSS